MDHFDKKRDSFNGLFLKTIIYGGSKRDKIDWLRHKAREYLDKAKLVNNADEAIQLLNAFDLIPDKTTKNAAVVNVIYKKWFETYDIEHDDLFIIASFENFAKAILLSKGYVVHVITKPNILHKRQFSSPIHINTIRSEKNISSLYLKHNTISMTYLLKPEYVKKIGISEKELYSLKQCKMIRNSIHFGGPVVHTGICIKFYEGLIELKKRIFQ